VKWTVKGTTLIYTSKKLRKRVEDMTCSLIDHIWGTGDERLIQQILKHKKDKQFRMISKQKSLISFWSLGSRAVQETCNTEDEEQKDTVPSIPSSCL
jgi:hypothetical protein